ncbi:hypothetical protein [Stenotrophomonas tumulicola]|uniref:Uncharacterized protein n=1 Tax=Stenotrophomonas tumulicola TaxID=1685415 RepID=A0A7W3FM13_9GAMM|nr:hypothetical protein [Stenotrophomonas tumulicola]MBA8682003.1 hypothetical protein [Stenotrophomonas tumulicola]
MNKFIPVRIRSQLTLAARSNVRSPLPEVANRLDQTFHGGTPNASWLLGRMIAQSNELDALINQLRRERRILPTRRGQPHWRPPHWLEATLSPDLVRDEYDALISALSARQADLGRTYIPLMNAVSTGKPVPIAVAAVVVA